MFKFRNFVFSTFILALFVSSKSALQAAETSPDFSSKLIGLFYKLQDVAADSKPHQDVSTKCKPGEHFNSACVEAKEALQSRQKRIASVRNAIPKLSKLPLEFTPEKLLTFSSEDDLVKKVLMAKTHVPMQVFKHDNSAIYFIRFGSSELQEAALARTGGYIEGNGKIARGAYPDGPSDGHDYQIHDFARFFNQAEVERAPLNPVEERLLQSLLKAGLLLRTRDEGTKKYTYISSQTAAIISVGADRLKEGVSHELNHAVYFTDSHYRTKIANLYKSGLTKSEKELVDKIMNDLSKNDEYNFKGNHQLLLTEFAAYFRDPDELRLAYLKTWDYPESAMTEIQAIAKKLKAQEVGIEFYTQNQTQPTGPTTKSRTSP